MYPLASASSWDADSVSRLQCWLNQLKHTEHLSVWFSAIHLSLLFLLFLATYPHGLTFCKQQEQGSWELSALQKMVLDLALLMRNACYNLAGPQLNNPPSWILCLPPACPVEPPKLSSWAGMKNLRAWFFRKHTAWPICRTHAGCWVTAPANQMVFSCEPTSPELWECGFQSDFHVSGLKFQGRIWTKYAFHIGQQFIYLLLMTLYLAAKEI